MFSKLDSTARQGSVENKRDTRAHISFQFPSKCGNALSRSRDAIRIPREGADIDIEGPRDSISGMRKLIVGNKDEFSSRWGGRARGRAKS